MAVIFLLYAPACRLVGETLMFFYQGLRLFTKGGKAMCEYFETFQNFLNTKLI
jgi:hypothetical protein